MAGSRLPRRPGAEPKIHRVGVSRAVGIAFSAMRRRPSTLVLIAGFVGAASSVAALFAGYGSWEMADRISSTFGFFVGLAGTFLAALSYVVQRAAEPRTEPSYPHEGAPAFVADRAAAHAGTPRPVNFRVSPAPTEPGIPTTREPADDDARGPVPAPHGRPPKRGGGWIRFGPVKAGPVGCFYQISLGLAILASGTALLITTLPGDRGWDPATPGPTPSPTPSPTPPVTAQLSSDGGSAEVACLRDGTVDILSYAPVGTYRTGVVDRSSPARPWVEFRRGNRTVRMTFSCSGGQPAVTNEMK